MEIKQFTQTVNLKMLWEVVSDEDIFKFISPDVQSKIYQMFINNIQGFIAVEKTNATSLVELNKKYVLLIINYIKTNYSEQPNKIKIYKDAPSKELITYEEIHEDKKSQFEKDLARRRDEFEDEFALKTPAVPEFADKQVDKPIKEMDKILKEMQIRRNYEVDNINASYSTNETTNWLASKETSIKPEKNITKQLKTVSFEKEATDDYNILSKLKVKKTDNIEDRMDALERNINNVNEKVDKLIAMISMNK